MSKPKATNGSQDDNNLDLTKIFPASKIKSYLHKDERVGRLLNRGVEFVGACSGLFLQQLVQDAAPEESKQQQQQQQGGAISLEQIQQCVSTHKDKYDFLEDTVNSVREKQSASKYGDKKRKSATAPKNATTKNASAINSKTKKQKALEQSILEEGGIGAIDNTQASGLNQVIRDAQVASTGRTEIEEDDDDYD
mmetsp:Transcript_27303/g.38417  ORF Transcript_27303/g.38417 Transcript_27303/m.38417 type:complete len:194 (-) Transcript_27303:246-827(-)